MRCLYNSTVHIYVYRKNTQKREREREDYRLRYNTENMVVEFLEGDWIRLE